MNSTHINAGDKANAAYTPDVHLFSSRLADDLLRRAPLRVVERAH
jgi:hypothetical protein